MKIRKDRLVRIMLIILALIIVSVGFLIWQHKSYVKLIKAVEKKDNIKVEQLLKIPYVSLNRQSGPIPWAYFPEGGLCSPLEAACENGNYEAAKMLIDKGADASIVQNGCFSLLYLSMQSTEMDDYKLVKLLVENGANPHGVNKNDHESSLSVCARMGCSDDNYCYDEDKARVVLNTYKYLEKKCGNEHIVMEYGETPLFNAVANNNILLVNYFLNSNKFDINHKDNNGETCTFLLVKSVIYDVKKIDYDNNTRKMLLQILIDNGANIYVQNNAGKNIREYARENGDKYMEKLLSEYI